MGDRCGAHTCHTSTSVIHQPKSSTKGKQHPKIVKIRFFYCQPTEELLRNAVALDCKWLCKRVLKIQLPMEFAYRGSKALPLTLRGFSRIRSSNQQWKISISNFKTCYQKKNLHASIEGTPILKRNQKLRSKKAR